MRIRLTPVSASPARIACWIGAAPRQRGSNDAWIFTQPRAGQSSTHSGSRSPYATTTSRSGGRSSSPHSPARAGSASERGCATVSPWANAASFTGGGVSRRPRPAGRSGCVSTSGTRAPAATIASSAGTANAGVPAKAIRAAVPTPSMAGTRSESERRRGVDAGRDRFALAAGPLQIPLLEPLALQLGQIVDEELAFEVIHLVLHALREQAFDLELERLAVAVERLDLDALGPLDVLVQPRDRQTAFLVAFAALGPDDFRVDQAIWLVASLGDV